MNRLLFIYLSNAILIVICLCLRTLFDNGQYFLFTALFLILTTAVLNTFVVYVYHYTKLINVCTLRKYKIVCLCALLTFLPSIIDYVLVKYIHVFYYVKSTNSTSHVRYLWSEPYFLQIDTYIILALFFTAHKYGQQTKQE